MCAASLRPTAMATALASLAALALAYGLESWQGLVPCALCLLERWPYRIAAALGVLAAVVPSRVARTLLWLAVLTVLTDAAIAFVHVGVEAGWWPSPLAKCAAPHLAVGSITERLASMPARPAKPCDDPTYLIPGIPISLAMANLGFAVVFAGGLAAAILNDRRYTDDTTAASAGRSHAQAARGPNDPGRPRR